MSMIEEYNKLLKENEELKRNEATAPKRWRRVLAALRPIHRDWALSLSQDSGQKDGAPAATPALDPLMADRILDALLADDSEDALAAAEHMAAMHIVHSLVQIPFKAKTYAQDEAEIIAELQADKATLVAAIRTLVAQQLAMTIKMNPQVLAKQLLNSDIEEIRAMAGKAIPSIALKELDPQFVKNFLQAAKVQQEHQEKETIPAGERAILKAIGEGAHTQRNIAKILKVTQQGMSKSLDLERLIAKGYVELADMETGIVSDRVRLHLLTSAGISLFKALFAGQEPVIPQAQIHMKDDENFDYLRRQGYWIDELRFHALGFGMDAIPERTHALGTTGLSVRPDLTIYRGGEGDDVPVQVELGEKSWSTQKAQVTAGIVKCVAVFGRCDVWVESEPMVETLSSHLEKEKDYKKVAGGLPMKAPGQVRFFVLGGQKIRQFEEWPKPEAVPSKVVSLQ